MSIVLEPTEVAPGLRMLSLRTPTLPPATHTNAFLVGTGECVLVEPASGYADEIERTLTWIRSEQVRGLTLRALLLTHHHADHVGGAKTLRERLGVPIWAHERTAERLAGQLAIDRLLEAGERIELDGPKPMRLEVVHTPGHAPGHLCFLDPVSRSLIAGDMVAGVGTIQVEPVDGDMQLYLRSLEAMDALDTVQLLPAHGLPITEPRERLRFYIAHRLKREAKVRDALVTLAREARVDEVLPIAYADTSPLAWPFARGSVEAHLIKLEREGQVARRGERWLATT